MVDVIDRVRSELLRDLFREMHGCFWDEIENGREDALDKATNRGMEYVEENNLVEEMWKEVGRTAIREKFRKSVLKAERDKPFGDSGITDESDEHKKEVKVGGNGEKKKDNDDLLVKYKNRQEHLEEKRMANKTPDMEYENKRPVCIGNGKWINLWGADKEDLVDVVEEYSKREKSNKFKRKLFDKIRKRLKDGEKVRDRFDEDDLKRLEEEVREEMEDEEVVYLD